MSTEGEIKVHEPSSSLQPPSTSTSTNTTTEAAANDGNTNKILQKRWVCDVCKVKWFLDFKEACAHEENCTGVPSSVQDDEEDACEDGDNDNMVDVNSSMISNESDELAASSNADGGGENEVDAPSSETGALHSTSTKARVARKTSGSNTNDNDCNNSSSSTSLKSTGGSKKKKVSATEIFDVSEPELDNDDDDGACDGGSLKQEETTGSRRKSKRVRDNAVVAASKPCALKDSNSSSVTSTKTKKAKKKGNSNTTSKSKLSDKPSSKNNKKGSENGGGSGQVASIFLPKKKAPAASSKKSSKSSSSDDDNSSILPGVSKADYKEHLAAEKQAAQMKKNKRSAEKMDDGKVAKKNTKQLSLGSKKGKKARRQKEVMEIDSSSSDSNDSADDDSDDDVEYVAESKKAKSSTITNSKKKNQKNFLSKKELAEHQAADFFAKRKQAQAEERERQKKRDAARQIRLNDRVAEGEMELQQDCDKKSGSSLFSEPGKSKSLDKPTSSGSSSTVIDEEGNKVKCIPAVRFPCPTHVMSNDTVANADDMEVESVNSLSSSLQMLRDTPRYQHLTSDLSPSTSTEEAAYHLSGLFQDTDDAKSSADTSSTFDLLSTVFVSSSKKKKQSNESDKEVNNSKLWVDKHSMTSIPEDVLGSSNKVASKKLMDFVEEWKVRRHKSMQSMGQVKGKKKRRKKKKSGYDSDDSFLDEGGLENIFLVTGPTGSGKTRLVHAVAEQSECAVIEINSSEQRSGAALKRAIQETTQSHSSLAMSKKKKDQGKKGRPNGYFGKNKAAEDSEDSEDSDSFCSSDEESVRESHSLTVILIDEVDLLFDEDTAFWPALAQVSQKAKCPIVLTATSMPAGLNNFRFQYIALERPLPEECSIKMATVSKAEGMSFNDDINLEEKLKRLSLIAEACQCDMRKILNEMQLFHFAKSQQSNVKLDMDNFGLQPDTACSTSQTTVEEDRPLILSVEPQLVPRDRHTLITITGKGFSSTSFPLKPSVVKPSILLIGGKECQHFRVISDTKIVAVCPPCTIPEGVSENAIYEAEGSRDIDCLTCKFAEVIVRKKCSNGLLLDSSSCLDSKIWNIEYDIPLRDDCHKEKASKEDFIRKLNAQKLAQKKMAEENDGLMSSDEEEFDDKRDTPPSFSSSSDDDQDENENGDTKMDDTPQKASEELKDLDPEILLEEALDVLESDESLINEATLSTEVHRTSLLDVNQIADELERLSDAVLFEDSFTSLAIPSLSGSVEGFGFNATDSSSTATDPSIDKLTKQENKKPPSFETIYSTGVNEYGFFFGNGDSYVTYPNVRRDRQLLAYSELHSRGLGFMDNTGSSSVEENPENSKSGLVDEEGDEALPFLQLQSRIRSEDDIFLSPCVSPALSTLPSLLEQGLDISRKHGFTKDITPLLQLRTNSVALHALGIMHSVLANCDLWYAGLRHDDDDEAAKTCHIWLRDVVLDQPLSVDYLPYLRSFAHHENVARQQVKDMMKEDGDTVRGGRKTRTSSRRNIRRHYLDECAGGKDKTVEAKCLVLGQQLLEV